MKFHEIDIHDHARLTWACRRGMLELDVLLGNFLKRVYATLAVAEKTLFVQLLTYHDVELHAWLLGYTTSPYQQLDSIIQLIRHHARSHL